MMSRLETKRLILRQFTINDAAFIRQLVNDPASIQHNGDRGVRSLADAREYLSKGPQASYARNGFGFNLVELKSTGEPSSEISGQPPRLTKRWRSSR